MPYKDKERQKEAQRKHYQANEGAYKERAKNGVTKSRRRNQEFVILSKSVPCTDCQREYPSYVMDFDHVRGEKVKNIAKMVNIPVTLKVLAEEISKCDVVCSNCHRIRTHYSAGMVR